MVKEIKCTIGYKWFDTERPEEVYYEGGSSGDGFIFKDFDAFDAKSSDICYIAEYDLKEWRETMEMSSEYEEPDGYTYQQLLDMCCGSNCLAAELLEQLEWQHPETLLDEWLGCSNLCEVMDMLGAEVDWDNEAQYEAELPEWESYQDVCDYCKEKGLIKD